jgi:peptide/nickel transport system permease protein
MLRVPRVAGRLLQMLVVLWASASILFLLFRLMPSTPLAAYVDVNFTAEQQQDLIRQFGLDRSLYEQYVLYIGQLLRGELGLSFHYRAPVSGIIFDAFTNTIVLTLTGLLIAYVIGIPIGAYLAWKRGSLIEQAAIPAVLTTRAAPEFWLGMVLLAFFSFNLGWFPSGGANSAGAEFGSEAERLLSLDFLHHLTLPAITLALHLQGLPVLLMRSNMLDVMNDEFVVLAHMKGLSTWTVMMRYCARNALLPVVTAFALSIGYSVGGNVVVETVFSWPGLGRLLVNAVAESDYPLAQGAFLMITTVLVTMNFVADLLYSLLDPRVAYASDQ